MIEHTYNLNLFHVTPKKKKNLTNAVTQSTLAIDINAIIKPLIWVENTKKNIFLCLVFKENNKDRR